jgi:hypothetical protein
MRVWNLSELSELNQVVVDEFPKTAFGRERRLRRPTSARAHFQIMAGVTSVAICLSLGNAIVNQSTVRLPNWSAAIARTVPILKPPLEEMFRDRFDSEWTQAGEQSLVNQIVENLVTRNAANDAASTAQFVCSNQQESITLGTPRLSLEAIAKIVGKRKTS